MITAHECDKLEKDYLILLTAVTYNAEESFDDIVKSKPLYERMSLEWALGGYLAYT